MKVQVLRGFRDYLPAEMLAKTRMLNSIAGVFESFGYPPLQTPALEYSEVLLGKYGEEGDLLMYRFQDNGGRDVCMRYDLTVPLARVLALHGELAIPFRRYQIAPVWRAEKPGRGRFREFVQCDADLVGVDDVCADLEMLLIGISVLRALGVNRFKLRLNHRGILRGLTRALGIEDPARAGAFLRLLDKIEKIGRDEFLTLARAEIGLGDRAVEILLKFIAPAPDSAAALTALAGVVGEDPAGAAALERLRALVTHLDGCGVLADIVIDPSIARGLTYYTGVIYETILEDLPDIGSVMSGGRYDGLVGIFANRELPAVGISLGVDRLFAALTELNSITLEQTPARVLMTIFDEASRGESLRCAGALRAKGISCVLYPAPAKLKKQLQYADALGVPYCAILGSDEIASGRVTLRAMKSGEQFSVTLDEAIARLRGTA